MANVWKTTTQASNGGWDDPIYPEFFAAVREVNSRLPANLRIRVLGGDPGLGDNRSREIAAVALLKERVLQKHSRALVIYGAAHFYRAAPKDYLSNMGQDIGIVKMVKKEYPGRTFAVIPVGYRWAYPPSIFEPDYRKFDRALKTHVRPVLVSLQHLPFRDFSAQEFVDPLLNVRGPGGPVSVFKGNKLTLGQMADACVYFDDSK